MSLDVGCIIEFDSSFIVGLFSGNMVGLVYGHELTVPF